MSKIKELKEKNPILSWSIIDMLSEIDQSKTNKYLGLMLNIFNESGFLSTEGVYGYDLKQEKNYWMNKINSKGFNFKIEDMDSNNIIKYVMFTTLIENVVDDNVYRAVLDFMDLCESGYMKGLDVNQVKNFEQLKFLVNSNMINKIEKELSKQVIKVHEDEKWVLVRPITWEASKKYGASTKWCTSSNHEGDAFYRYSHRGILLYCINKKDGTKTAFFKTVPNGDDEYEIYDKETSFWNDKDNRIDSMETDLDGYILDIIKKIEPVSNEKLGGEIFKESYTKYFGDMTKQEKIVVREHLAIPVPVEQEFISNYDEFDIQ